MKEHLLDNSLKELTCPPADPARLVLQVSQNKQTKYQSDITAHDSRGHYLQFQQLD